MLSLHNANKEVFGVRETVIDTLASSVYEASKLVCHPADTLVFIVATQILHYSVKNLVNNYYQCLTKEEKLNTIIYLNLCIRRYY